MTGDLVQIVPFATQRDRRWFDAPGEFRPTRFLGPPAWPRYAYLPFGGGPRICIGNHFALMEGHLLLAALAQRVTLTLAPGQPLPVQVVVPPVLRR